MVVKIVVIALLLLSIYFLLSAVYYMMKDEPSSKRMAKALTWRVSIGVLLVVILIGGYYAGWITPHPL